MTPQEILSQFAALVDEAKACVLATVDTDGGPHLRWMTPACLKDRPGAVFMVSGSEFPKIDHLRANPRVELMIQSPGLDRVLNLRGTVTVVEHPSLRTEVLECLGGRLYAFWKVNEQPERMVVLEMAVTEAAYYLPMKGSRETVSFT